MPLSSIYSFQNSAGVTAHMFRAVAKVTSLSHTHTVLLRGGHGLVGSVHKRASLVHWTNLQIARCSVCFLSPSA